MILTRIIPFSDWPLWVRILVLVPHVALTAYALYIWWPKSGREENLGLLVAAYLLAFVLVMKFVFHF